MGGLKIFYHLSVTMHRYYETIRIQPYSMGPHHRHNTIKGMCGKMDLWEGFFKLVCNLYNVATE